MSGTPEPSPSRVCRFVDSGRFGGGDSGRVFSWLLFTSRPWRDSGRLPERNCRVIGSLTANRRADRFNHLGGTVALLVLISIGVAAAQAVPPANWLNRPLAGWNKPGLSVGKAPRFDEERDQTLKRCRLTLL